MRRFAWAALSALLVVPQVARSQAPPANPVVIGTMDSLWSATLKEQRRFLVYTPPSYHDTTYAPQRYPVLYLLDGDAHFHSVTGLVQILGTGINGTYVVPEMIVVAIPNTDRTRDMTPTHRETDPQGKPQPFLKTSGGMASFFRFLTSELMSKIDAAYRTAPYRVLVGHSLGGITAINALYTIPEAFQGYVAIDPSLWYDDQLLLRQAKERVSRPEAYRGRSLFVAQANTINPDDTTSNTHFSAIVQFNSVLETYNASGLRYAYQYYANDDHGSVPIIAEYEALRFLFDGYRLDLMRSLERPAYIVEHFAKVSELLGYEVRPPERTIDFLGRIQLGRDTTKALELLELNATLYADRPRAHSALGDAWLARRDFARATAAYERALALAPGHQHARSMLEKAKAGKQ